MNLNASMPGSSNRKSRWSEIEANGYLYAAASNSSRSRGRDDDAGEQRFGFLRGAQTRLVPPPKNAAQPKADLLSRALSWLRGEAPSAKHLRLAETVSLGEKRFVAIIHAEGHKYLVGGGAAGVVLLTRLDGPADSAESFQPLEQLIGTAG